ncbi:hypothetical protein ABTO78_18235, partial [Acinetobacter baumannii]
YPSCNLNFSNLGKLYLQRLYATKPLQDEVLLKFDSSLIPSYKNEEDFILWLADFIDRITIDTSKGDYPIKKNLANLSSIAEKLMYRH